ncbi:MAG: hypothetical protein DMF61_06835 [Blastocatellia bacterium AA13]|nr:MAG: hypothetical protein DMF61_06835 [Blastocatellia bacterium AA13]
MATVIGPAKSPPRAPTLPLLLGKGYFPRELPPVFHTESFAAYAVGTGTAWPDGRWTALVRHNLARPGGLRRPLRIPNPVSYFKLAEILVTNWKALRNHTWAVRVSLTRPYVMKNSPRAVVPRYAYRELPRLRALRRRGARYLLRTDIAEFYSTIYTHTIPWALHTKSVCKAALKKKKGMPLLGAVVDAALAAMNEGQTHGIPIGPDSSLLLAETLLAAVDKCLIKDYGSLFRGFRYVDDYELSFATLSDAETVLTALQGLLSEYELILNPRKTKIEELPKLLDDEWAIDLGRFNLRDSSSPKGQRNDILALFSRAFEFAEDHPHESVLRYTVGRVRSLDVHANAWRAFQNCLLNAAGADPSTMAGALGTLHLVANAGGHTVFKTALAETFESVIHRHAPRAEGSEVAWALWGALAWSVPLSEETAKLVSKMDDDIVALLALDVDYRDLFPPGTLDRSLWATVVNEPDVLSSQHWLLAYEANQKTWLECPGVAADPIFSGMSKAGVSFYDPSRGAPMFPEAAHALPGGLVPDYYA